MHKFSKDKLLNLLTPLIFVILGILFIVFNNSISNYIVIILGIFVCLIGLEQILYTALKKEEKFNSYNLSKSSLLIISGLILLIFSNQITNIIMILCGLYVLISGSLSLFTAYKLYFPSKERNIRLIFAGIEVLIGLILTFAPASSTSLINIFIGVYLLYKGITMCISSLFLKENKTTFYKYKYSNENKVNNDNIIDHDEIDDDDILKKD